MGKLSCGIVPLKNNANLHPISLVRGSNFYTQASKKCNNNINQNFPLYGGLVSEASSIRPRSRFPPFGVI